MAEIFHVSNWDRHLVWGKNVDKSLESNHVVLGRWPIEEWFIIAFWDQFTIPKQRLLPDETEEILSLSAIPVRFQWNMADCVKQVTSARLPC